MRALFTIHSRVQRAMLVAIAAALVTIALKLGAWALTGSLALYSDAVEGLVNLAAATLGFILLGLAAQPADAEHPYGHEKAEYFASGFEGLLILVAALAIGWQGVQGFITPTPLEHLDHGLLLSFLATLVNGGVALWLLRVGREEGSLAVEADARHLLTDVWTSAGMLATLLLLLVFPAAWWLDPLVALAVAFNIVRTGLHLLRHSVGALMDTQLPSDEFGRIEARLRSALPGPAVLDGLRTRKAGPRRFVEFNLLVPGGWTVHQSHQLCDCLEAAIRAEFPKVDIRIHVEPLAGAP